MNPLISVIVPVYKVEKYLHRCIDSILAQTYENIEVLLIDDGSPDQSGAICDDYQAKDSRVRVFHKENGGVSSARNLGLKEAKGDYIGFVDADDYIDSLMYEVLLNNLKTERADIAICGYQKDLSNGLFEAYWKEKTLLVFNREEMISNLLANRYYTCAVWSMLFKKSLANQVVFDVKRKHNEDLLYIYEVMKLANTASYASDPHYYYCTNEGSATTSGFSDSMMDIVYISEYILIDIKKNLPSLYPLEKREFMRNNIICATGAAKENYNNKENIQRIRKNIKRFLIWYLFSNASLGYKRLALLVSISWSLYKKVIGH